MSEAASTPPAALFGTDAHLAPSPPDAVLRYAGHARGVAELRLPAGAGPFPLAVMFHGGCWKAGVAGPAYMAPLAARWQQAGVASLNLDYREVGDGGGWPGSFADWARVERLLDGLANDPRIDLTRLTFVGHSAGALPAQWLAAAQGADGPLGARQPRRAADAIVFDGPADLARETAAFDALCEFSAVAPFMGGTAAEQPARYAAISPVAHPPRLGRVLFVQAKLPAPAAATVSALEAAGARVAVIAEPEASHFDVITPGAPAYERAEPQILAILHKDGAR